MRADVPRELTGSASNWQTMTQDPYRPREQTPAPTDEDREALIALGLASVRFIAGDGYPSTAIRTNEEAADAVLAAGFRRQPTVTAGLDFEARDQADLTGASRGGGTWRRAYLAALGIPVEES